jgi:hypothetical protein
MMMAKIPVNVVTKVNAQSAPPGWHTAGNIESARRVPMLAFFYLYEKGKVIRFRAMG